VAAIKLISIFADLINAVLVFRLVRLQFPTGWKPYLAAGLFLVLPTLLFNSAVWGQADAIYTLFLLACLYFLMNDRPLWGMIFFGIAFAFKAQAIFLAPFLFILFFQGRIRWQHFLAIPGMYLLLALPAVLLGQSWLNVLLVYADQGSTYHDLSRNAPNLYFFLPQSAYKVGVPLGILLAWIVTAGWVWINVRGKPKFDNKLLVLTALASVALVPFLLPKMHERYFYPADVFSFLLAFFLPQFWLVAVAYQVLSLLAYFVFLFDFPPLAIQIGAILNTVIVMFLVWKQVKGVPSCSQTT
jgi:Gpi18-like mannosyltransferase